MKKKKSLFARFVKYYKPHKLLFSVDMFFALSMSLIGLIYPILTRKIFQDFVPNENVAAILICGGCLIGIYFVRFFLKYFVDYFGHCIGVKMQAAMRRDLFDKIEDLPFSYFDNTETGKIMARLTQDLFEVSELAHHGPENILISGVMLIGSFIYLLTINWILALALFAVVPVLLLISITTRQAQLRAFEQARKENAVINANIESAISGIRVTKAFNNKQKEKEKFEVGNQRYCKASYYKYKRMAIFHSSTNFSLDLFNVVCIVGGGLLTIYTGVFKLEDYLAFAIAISLFTQPLQTLVNFVEQLQDGITGFRRFSEIMDMESEYEKPNAIKDIVLKGNIKFDHVSFKYETSEEVLNDICFDIKEGETIALVGASGGGKTTICHLIPNFYRINKGTISIDGIDINDISLQALRGNIGIVQQDVFLFAGTLRDNITYGKLDATDEEVIEAAKKANLYDFVLTLPNGLDTEVGERGVKLSGGQKQRVSIARIFLRNPSILILDEATSALDNTTEMQIQQALNELAKGRTNLIVAHRLSTIRNADRIFVINHGNIVECGTHEELMKNKGDYYVLYNQQFKVSSFGVTKQ